MLAVTSALGWDRVKVSENLGATTNAPVAPVVTSLFHDSSKEFDNRCYSLPSIHFKGLMV